MEGRSAFALLLFAASLSHAFGNHFRGGHLNWRPADQPGQVCGSEEVFNWIYQFYRVVPCSSDCELIEMNLITSHKPWEHRHAESP